MTIVSEPLAPPAEETPPQPSTAALTFTTAELDAILDERHTALESAKSQADQLQHDYDQLVSFIAANPAATSYRIEITAV